MDIAEWRKKIDELDRKLVQMLNERAHAAQEIGQLKRNTTMPIYEPEREKVILNNVRAHNTGPLDNLDLTQIYERIIDVMRRLQQREIAPPKPADDGGETEQEAEIND